MSAASLITHKIPVDTQSHEAVVCVTRFTSVSPLAKIVHLGPDGCLVKKSAAQMYKGRFETLSFPAASPGAAQRLVTLLQDFTTHQALSSSLSLGADAGEVTTQKALAVNAGAVARDARHFGYRPGVAGLLALDIDPRKGADPLSPESLWTTLLDLWPEAADGIVVHLYSASSLIFHEARKISGMEGQRFYIAIRSQCDIPRALSVLNKRAWLKGIGAYVMVSACGSLLTRSLFDPAMGDAGGRLDFGPSGAICQDGLEQRRGLPTVFADGALLDTRATLPDLSPAEEAEVQALIAAAKLRARQEAQTKGDAWLASRQQTAVIAAIKEGGDPSEVSKRVKLEHEALLSGMLLGGAELVHVTDEGAEVTVAVDQMLADPSFWHGKRFLSPHDPDHRGRSPDAMAYLLQATPILFDLNDTVRYRLQRQPVRLQVAQGERAALADRIAAELVSRPDLLNCAGQLVRVVDGEFVPASRPFLKFAIGTHIALFRRTKDGKNSAVDVDNETVEIAQALLCERARKVKGRSSIPLIDVDGRVIDVPGLDAATGIYLDIEADPEPIPDTPSRMQTVEAIRRAWRPLSLYRWESLHDKAAVFATELTVPLRPTIDGAPGLFVDAAQQASGKSSACGAILMLIQGHKSGVKSWTSDGDIEIEKYLLSLAKAGAPAVAWDNVLGVFDSASIATAIVEGRVSARQLGATQALSPAFRAMWLASGNQASLGRDCGTRFLQARIASDGQPHQRSFPWEPSEAALGDRHGIVRAILTIHRAWHSAGCPRTDGTNTRFSAWGRTIRQMVLWLESSGMAAEAGIGSLGDPGDSILHRESASDPDTESSTALLSALHRRFGNAQPFTAREVAAHTRAAQGAFRQVEVDLWDSVMTFFPRGSPSPQSLAAVFRNRRDRTYAGLRLVMLPKGSTREDKRSGQLFAVVEV